MPTRTAIAHDSEIAAIVAPAIRLLQSFAAWPAPWPPTSTTRPPSSSKSGRARSNASAAPPTMIVNVASDAPRGPPLTGASRTSSSGTRRQVDARATAGWSTCRRGASRAVHSSARPACPARPPRPTPATEGTEARRRPRQPPRPTSRRRRARSASTRVESRSQPTTSCPPATRCRAIGSPIVPRPITATRISAPRGARCRRRRAARAGGRPMRRRPRSRSRRHGVHRRRAPRTSGGASAPCGRPCA